jgi:hypothetical protein
LVKIDYNQLLQKLYKTRYKEVSLMPERLVLVILLMLILLLKYKSKLKQIPLHPIAILTTQIHLQTKI